MAATNRLLKRVAVGIFLSGTSSCIGLYLWKRRKYRNFLRDHFESSPYYSLSWQLFLGYPDLANHFETPVEKKSVNAKDRFNEEFDGFAKLAIPVKDNKGQRAFLVTWASEHESVDNNEKFWRVDRLDIKKNHAVTFYLHPDIQNGGHPEAIAEKS